MISDILCYNEPTRLEKTKLFFEAIRGTSNFNTLLESVGEPQTATDVANCIFQVENGEAGVFINELLNGRPIVESYTPPVFGVFTDPNIPTIRTINGGEYVCRTANPSIASEKYAICESITHKIERLCAYLESEQDPRTAQKLQNIADLVSWGDESDPTSLVKPLRDEITDWFLLDTSTVPQEAQLTFIIRSLIAESLKNGSITPARIKSKLKSTLWADDQFGNMYDNKTGKKVEGFREVKVDMTENPNRFGSTDFDDEYEDYTNSAAAVSDIPRQASDFISKLYERISGTNINGRFLDSVIGNVNATDSFLYIISDTEDGRVPQDISREELLDALDMALTAKAKTDPASRRTVDGIWNIAVSLEASNSETPLSKEAMLKRLETANTMQEQNLDGEEFSMSDLKNIAPLKGEGDSKKTAHENTNALMIGMKQLPGLDQTLISSISSNGFRRTLNVSIPRTIAIFDEATASGEAFKKVVAAYETVRYLCKAMHSLWVLAVFGPKSKVNSKTWAKRTLKTSQAIRNIDARNLIEYATKISDPNLVKAGAPQINAEKLRAIYNKVKSTVAEAEATSSNSNASDDEIRNLWAFGFKASFDTGIEEAEETAVA
jgi:hypothetical protein